MAASVNTKSITAVTRMSCHSRRIHMFDRDRAPAQTWDTHPGVSSR